MRKLIIALALLGVCATAHAEALNIGETLSKLPGINNGVAWDFDKREVTYLSTIRAIDKNGFALNIGYSSGDKIIAGASYDLINLKKLGVNVPILDLIKIEPIVYAGFGSINGQALEESEFTWGVGVNILEVKF